MDRMPEHKSGEERLAEIRTRAADEVGYLDDDGADVRFLLAQLAEAERREAENDVRYAGAMRLLLEPLERVVQTTVALTPREAAALLSDVRAALQDHLQEPGQ
jgi:hypothetical protein